MEDDERCDAPSADAVARLAQDVATTSTAYREAVDADLAVLERAAAEGLDDVVDLIVRQHVARLERFRDGMVRAVADAVCHREAEAVVGAAAGPPRA